MWFTASILDTPPPPLALPDFFPASLHSRCCCPSLFATTLWLRVKGPTHVPCGTAVPPALQGSFVSKACATLRWDSLLPLWGSSKGLARTLRQLRPHRACSSGSSSLSFCANEKHRFSAIFAVVFMRNLSFYIIIVRNILHFPVVLSSSVGVMDRIGKSHVKYSTRNSNGNRLVCYARGYGSCARQAWLEESARSPQPCGPTFVMVRSGSVSPTKLRVTSPNPDCHKRQQSAQGGHAKYKASGA